MQKRNGAITGRQTKPKVKVDVKREKVRRSFSLSKESSQILDSYVTFLENHLGGKVTADQVIEERLFDLSKDRLWKEWHSKQNASESQTSN